VKRNFCALLEDRGVISVTGPDAHKLLQGVITNDMDVLDTASALHTGLLSPQGKILFEFFVVKSSEGFLLDVTRDQAAALVKRLTMYKLRAAAELKDVSETMHVLAVWGDSPYSFDSMAETVEFNDPRLAAMGLRIITPAKFSGSVAQATNGSSVYAGEYHAHRIALGVPEGGKDYAFGDAFPHEALFDQLHSVSFTKGCYVGQEIVSRMEHRGTARKRIVPVEATGSLPAPGADIKAGEVTIGALGSVSDNHGLALLRLDRVTEFAAKGVPLTAGDAIISVAIPSWATFSLPAPDAQNGTT
jgi:tRNA-modifying protein YgfZ